MVQGTIYLPKHAPPTQAVIYSRFHGRTSLAAKLLVFAAVILGGLFFIDSRHQGELLAQNESALPSFSKQNTVQSNQQELLVTKPPRIEASANWIPEKLVINKIGLDSTIKEVSGGLGNWEVPDELPGTPSLTSRVGGDTNISVWGHRGTIFTRLGEMQIGDTIYAGNSQGMRQYKIYEVKVISPNPDDGVEILPTQDNILTIVTCHPEDIFNERLIIHAKLVDPSVPASISGFAGL